MPVPTRGEARGPPRQPPTHRGARAPEGSGAVRPARRIRALDNAVLAHNFASGVRSEEVDRELEGMSHGDLLDLAMVSIVQICTAAVGLRSALAQTSESLTTALARAKKYRDRSLAQAEGLARLHTESTAREEGLTKRLKEMEGRATAAEARANLALGKLESALQRAGAAEGAAEAGKAAAEEARAAGERAAAAEKAAAEAMAEKAGAVAYADEASARAGEAEEKARELEARVREAEKRAQEAEARCKEAEEKAREAAAGAVADFKASGEFRQTVIEGSLEAFTTGFDLCKTRVAAAFQIDISELEDIQAGGPEEGPAEGGDDDEPAPGEP